MTTATVAQNAGQEVTEAFDPRDLLARILMHVVQPRAQVIRYYGEYSVRARSTRIQDATDNENVLQQRYFVAQARAPFVSSPLIRHQSHTRTGITERPGRCGNVGTSHAYPPPRVQTYAIHSVTLPGRNT